MTKQESILQALMGILTYDGTMVPEVAATTMVHWIAYKIGVEQGMLSPTISLEVWNKLEDVDLSGLCEDPRDHISDFLMNYYGSIMTEWPYMTKSYAKTTTQALIRTIAIDKMNRLLDKCAGSGAVMIEIWEALKPNTIVYAAEPNLDVYRVALVNAKLYNIPSRILNADCRIHNIADDSPNWRYAGMWTPPVHKFIRKLHETTGK